MAWHPHTLRDALDNGETPDIKTHVFKRRPGRGDQTPTVRYVCECGAQRPPELLVDVRNLPIGGAFVCDGCWSTWRREGRVVDAGSAPANRKEWTRRWAQALGAPKSLLDKIDAGRTPMAYQKNRVGRRVSN